MARSFAPLRLLQATLLVAVLTLCVSAHDAAAEAGHHTAQHDQAAVANATSCQDGYVLVNGECVMCNAYNCITCVPGDTEVCAPGGCVDNFISVNGHCEFFCKVVHCLTCNPADRYDCRTCNAGYQLKTKNRRPPYFCGPSAAIHGSAVVALAIAGAAALFAL